MPHTTAPGFLDSATVTTTEQLPGSQPGVTRTRGVCTAHGWTITWVECTPGSVRVSAELPGIVLVVGDDATCDLGSTTVLLGTQGSAIVRAESAPPALLLGSAQRRIVPRAPGVDDPLHLNTVDRLLVLSADALEALPSPFPQQRPWHHDLHGQTSNELLTLLFGELTHGSGAVIVRERAPHHTGYAA
ncbi:MAG: hypothetical protein ACRCTR_09390 [Actinomycetota bacterium]